MNDLDSAILAVRCLNETRLLHPPTYIGSRYLADSIISDSSSSLAFDAITRKYHTQLAGRFHRYLRYKKIGENGQNEYREFLISSPWTCLAETIALSALGESKAFSKPANIYSYPWPKNRRCPFNFEHYFDGYQARNRAIASHFNSNPGDVALVADIERFYPSIQHARLPDQFTDRLLRSGIEPSVMRTASRLVDHLIDQFPNGIGIPTGPAFSHMLADVCLTDVDRALQEKFGDRYFRYVDDFVFVIPPNEVEQAQKTLATLLKAEGLTTNQAKSDIVSSDKWLSFGPRPSSGVIEHSFEALVFQLKVFLAAHPTRYHDLRKALMDAGFNLPLGRIVVNSRRVGFRQRTAYLLRRGWKVAWSAIFSSINTLVEYADVVRTRYVDRLKSLAASKIPAGGVTRRWHIQRMRYVTNRLLYLLPLDGFSFVEEAINGIPEFRETLALLQLVMRREVAPLLEMPGAAVIAAASILENNAELWKPIQLPNQLSPAGIHSASILLLYGVALLPPDLLNTVSRTDRELLSFCAGEAPPRGQSEGASYIDELRTLQMNQPASERTLMLTQRYSESETSEFEALEIGEDHFT